jgi:rubrerythrin
VNRNFSMEQANLTRSADRGLGVCILAYSTKHLWRCNFCGYMVEELEAPVMGAVADHCGGYAYDEDARFGN